MLNLRVVKQTEYLHWQKSMSNFRVETWNRIINNMLNHMVSERTASSHLNKQDSQGAH
jgi:hypothetical protein